MGNEGRPREPERWDDQLVPMHKFRKKKRNAFRPLPEFFALADPIVETQKTRLGYDRLYVLWQVTRNLARTPGDVIEVGTFRGGSAYFLASVFRAFDAAATIHVVDTFTGHPPDAMTDRDSGQEAGRFSETSEETVRDYLSAYPEIAVMRGDICELFATLPERRYRLVHLDTDLYRPTLESLRYFVPRMSPGGVIVVDDYTSGKCQGVAEAAEEFLAEHPGVQVWDLRTEQLVIVRVND